MPLINMTDEYQTRDGRKVRVLCVDRAKPDIPVVALVQMDSGWESAFYYRPNGQTAGEGRQLDLIPVPKKHKRTVWLAHGRDGRVYSYSKKPTHFSSECVAVTGPHEIEFTEGEGLAGAEGGA